MQQERVLLLDQDVFEKIHTGCYEWQISYDRPVTWSGGFSCPGSRKTVLDLLTALEADLFQPHF